jgi:4-hydroxy-2-oxoheptanedioate aldolase
MIDHPVKRLWAEGKAAVNGWLSIGDGFTAEIMASAGYASVTADLQHGAFDYHAMLGMFQAMRASGAAPMGRVPWLDAGAVMKALDAGAYGVICPMVNSRADAERLVSYVRYPPGGTRSFGPTRANFSAGPNCGPPTPCRCTCRKRRAIL